VAAAVVVDLARFDPHDAGAADLRHRFPGRDYTDVEPALGPGLGAARTILASQLRDADDLVGRCLPYAAATAVLKGASRPDAYLLSRPVPPALAEPGVTDVAGALLVDAHRDEPVALRETLATIRGLALEAAHAREERPARDDVDRLRAWCDALEGRVTDVHRPDQARRRENRIDLTGPPARAGDGGRTGG